MRRHSVGRRAAQLWLGTLVDIAAEGPSAEGVDRAIAAAFAEIASVHQSMSAHAPDSELVRVNRAAMCQPQRVSGGFHAVLCCALDIAAASCGAFDPTVGGVLGDLGFVPRHACSGRATWRDVHVDAHGVRFARPLQLDFGGIAKGYAVDRAIAALREHGVTSGCVDAGGDLRVFGRRARVIHVRTSGAHATALSLVRLAQGALATSGYASQRRRVAARWATPLIDGTCGLPRMSTRTVSVVAPSCMLADALTKVVALRGRDAAPVLARYGASATILTPARGRWRCTRV
jgi:FAD:protein FMN transferase